MVAKRRSIRAPSSSSSSVKEEEPPQTQFVPEEDDEDNLWSAIEILDERGKPGKGEYLVKWAGVDRSTGEPWEPTWEPKQNCTPALISHWRKKKEQNPTLIGREGKKLTDEKAKPAHKRKRSEGPASASKRSKPVVEVPSSAGRGRGRESKGRAALTSDSNSSDDFPEPADINLSAPSTRIRNRVSPIKADLANSSPGARAGLRVRQSRQSTTYNESSSEDDAMEESSFQPSSSSKRSKREARSDKTTKKRTSTVAKGGPGPSTAAYRSRENSPNIPSPAKQTRPPSSDMSLVAPTRIALSDGRVFTGELKLTAVGTQPSGTDHFSQADPISQFPSPPHVQGEPVPNTDIELQGQLSGPGQTAVKDTANGDNGKNGKGVAVQTLRDGEMVTEALSDNDQSGSSISAAGAHQNIGNDQPNAEFDDADLDDLRSDSQVEDSEAGDEANHNEHFDPSDVGGSTTLPEDGLNGSHAGPQSSPSADKNPQTQSNPTAAPSTDPHPDTISLAIALKRCAALATQLGELNRRYEVLLNSQPDRPTVPPVTAVRASGTSAATVTKPPVETKDVASGPEHGDQPTDPAPPSKQVNTAELSSQSQNIATKDKPQEQQESDSIIHKQAAEIEQLKAEVTQLKSDNRLSEERRTSLLNDNIFLRKQYLQASDRAVEEVRETKKLQSKVSMLKTQLSLGLKQRDMHNQKIAKDKDDEIRKYRAQLHILTEQNRLTDDKVRMKAVFYDQYKKERGGMQTTIENLTVRVNSLQDRNEELKDLADTLRAQQMGVIPHENERDNEDSDYQPSAASSSSNSRSPSPLVGRKKANGASGHDKSDLSLSAQSMDGVLVPALSGATGIRPGEGYVCAWREGDKACRVVCDTVEELHNHGVTHQRANVTNHRA
ncbi:hypothetical protein I316_01277 [Kwoniella heveanensis BCC8398]|uniref:Chromo domain-containing protein n=1 Tax=Kwoniella heveanensis BCC8398 TaxID=1296120 RepID=A0A1B9H081_9TREE|nr:hypothetical protein I316_01277 [Kwoniella heveanensis BCC8398]